MLKGKKIGLLAVERADLKQLLEWRNNVELRKYFREYREINMAQQEKWFAEKVLHDPSTMMLSIRNLKNNELLGCCGLVDISWVYRHAELSLYIGWKNSYIDNLGYAKESARLLLDYGFKELCLNKIWTEVYIFDKKKKKLYDNLGFKVDGVLRQNYFYDKKFWDSYIMSILTCEWINRKRGK